MYGNSAVTVFLGLYIGVIVLFSSAAVLVIQQLSEASSSLQSQKFIFELCIKSVGIMLQLGNNLTKV